MLYSCLVTFILQTWTLCLTSSVHALIDEQVRQTGRLLLASVFCIMLSADASLTFLYLFVNLRCTWRVRLCQRWLLCIQKKRNRILADYFDMFVKKAAAGVYDGESWSRCYSSLKLKIRFCNVIFNRKRYAAVLHPIYYSSCRMIVHLSSTYWRRLF